MVTCKVIEEITYDPLQVVTVGQAISNDEPVVTIPASTRVEDLPKSHEIMNSKQSVYPVLNVDRTLHGIITRSFIDQLSGSSLIGSVADYDQSLSEICDTNFSLRDALTQMMLHDKIVLPVIADKKTYPRVFKGLITYDRIQQVLKSKHRELAQRERILHRPRWLKKTKVELP